MPNEQKNAPMGTIFMRNITAIDCGIFDLVEGIIGQSWTVDLEISGQLDEQGMVHDFSDVKSKVRSTLVGTIDHALIVPADSTAVCCETPDAETESWTLSSQNASDKSPVAWNYTCPKGSVYPINSEHLNTDIICSEINRTLSQRLPKTITEIKICLREEALAANDAVFRYTHGITSHAGLCQRLFHGHRSLLEVFVDNKKSPELENYVVTELFGKNVHIVSLEQLKAGSIRSVNNELVEVSYKAKTKSYAGKIPANKLYVVEGETSIENLANTLAKVLRNKLGHTAGKIKVMAYEGIGKGAVAEA